MAPTSDRAGIRHTMRAHYFLWRLCGLLPQPNDPLWYPIYARFMHFNGLVFITCMLLSFSVATSWADCVQVLLLANTFILTVVKAFIFLANFERVEETLTLMRKLEVTTDGVAEEREMLHNCARWSQRMLVLLSFFCYFGVSSISVEPLMGGQKLIYPSIYPFNWLANRPRYYATFFYQWASNLSLVAFIPTVDIYGPAMYLHLATYMRILCGRMEQLGGRWGGGGAKVDGRFSTANRKELIECVEYHTLCLRLARELNDIFGMHFAIQFSTSSFILCVAAFQFSLINPIQTPIDFVFCVEYLLAMASEIFLPCYCGSLVLEISDNLSRSLYRSNWIPQTVVYKSIMSVFMERAKWPMKLHIYQKFCIINLGAFGKISRFAYSMLTFLKSF